MNGTKQNKSKRGRKNQRNVEEREKDLIKSRIWAVEKISSSSTKIYCSVLLYQKYI
jgi:hypothetical protein